MAVDEYAELDKNAPRRCIKCGRVKKNMDFYRSKNVDKYPEFGLLNVCKKCLTLHIDNWDPSTYLSILEDLDVPYLPWEWNSLMEKYAQDPKKVNGTTILGRYLAKMRIKQFSPYHWADTDFLVEMRKKTFQDQLALEGKTDQEIARIIAEGECTVPPPPRPDVGAGASAQSLIQKNLEQEQEEFSALTAEDKAYLKLKWGGSYTPEEWIWLEQFYTDMCDSFDIQSAAQIDTLKFICKTSLKMHHAIDADDVEAYQKYSKVYDAQMKSGKFTAAQNKEGKGEFVDSLGELFALCEKDGYIERYYVDSPQDKVDETIADMKRYTQSLVEGESNLGMMLEQAVRANAREDAEAAENTETEIVDEENKSIEQLEKEIDGSDSDTEFDEFIDLDEDAPRAPGVLEGDSDG